MTFKEFFYNEESGGRRSTPLFKLPTHAVNPCGPVRPDNLMPRPKRPKGKLSTLLALKRPPTTIISASFKKIIKR
jgi:hypothetical protein